MRKNAASPARGRGKDKEQGRVLVAALAALVILGTSCALIRPAVTISRGCEKKEHTHTDACYEQVTVAKHVAAHCTAGEATVLHQHDTSCYDEAGKLWCPLAELSEHQHTGTCYEVTNHLHNPSCYAAQRGALLCKVPAEEAEHTHVATCFDAEGQPICGMEGTSGHEHDDGCYQMTEVCICGHNEGETRVLSCTLPEASAHTHTVEGGCFDEAGALVCEKPELARHAHTQDCFTVAEEPVDTQSCTCGLEEDESHTHGARCYGTWRLVCGLEEHQHGAECAPDYICGLEEHTHTDACLDEEGVQVCGKQAHQHEEGCLPAEAPEYICGLAEHTHGETCVDEEGNLVCGLSEHTHGDECLAAKAPEYVCGLEEHTHDETCADEDGNLICGLTAHTHGAECLKIEYICGLEEHTHVGTCFDAEGALICGLAEHTHTESCVKPPEEIVCGKAEHLHEEGTCFDEAGNLICALEDHLHTAECVVLSEAARAKVEAVIAAIDGLKSAEELTVYFAGLEDAGDEDALVLAMLEEQEAFSAVCEQYYGLSEGQKLCVTNREKLEQLSELWNGTATLPAIGNPGYREGTIHKNIHLHLFDYGTNINNWTDPDTNQPQDALSFANNINEYRPALDGNYNNDNNTTGNPAMKRTLTPHDGEEKYPETADGKSLYYLFQEKDKTLFLGTTTQGTTEKEANDAYKKCIAETTINGNYKNDTKYASKSFAVNGDGGLFNYDEATGYYTYDSADESAHFLIDEQRFEKSDILITPSYLNGAGRTQNGNFLPFNKLLDDFTQRNVNGGKKAGETAANNNAGNRDKGKIINLGFGMTMEIEFYMPKGGKVNGAGMIFEFEGDDDVWVFIDDVLVLDIGGIHGAQYGSINFASGVITDNNGTKAGDNLKACFDAAGESTAGFNGNTFADWTKHTLKFYYLERGGNISYCRLKFNMPALPDGSLTVGKELEADDDTDAAVVEHLEGTLAYQYQVIKKVGETEEILKNAPYTLLVGTATTGTAMRTDKDTGIFSLLPGQKAQFENMKEYFKNGDGSYPAEGTYFVRELIPEGQTGQYSGVSYTVSGGTNTQGITGQAVDTTFMGYDSGAMSMLESNFVIYTNCVDTEKLSTLEIEKVARGAPAGDTTTYTFCVELGGVNLPAGTAYTVTSTNADGTTTTANKTVATEGQIQLKAGETAQIRLLAGTAYKVTEVIPTGAEYTATYSPENKTKDAAEGSVTTPGATATVTVTNTYSMGALTLTKLVNNTADPSNTSGTFTFQLTTVSADVDGKSFPVAVTDKDGKTVTGAPTSLSFTKSGEDTNVKYTAEITLQHSQTATLSDLPAGVSFTVTETTTDGYSVSWTKSVEGDEDGSETKTETGANAPAVTIASGETICLTCTNTRGVALPQTGGAGTFRFTAGGLLLILAAVWLFGRYNFPRRARNKQN